MIYNIIADIILIIHFIFIIFLIFGGLLILKWKWIKYIHIPAILWGISIEIFNYTCPLTPLEIYFRNFSESPGYETGFIEHYIMPLVYPPGLTRSIQFILAIALIIINVPIYLYIYKKR